MKTVRFSIVLPVVLILFLFAGCKKKNETSQLPCAYDGALTLEYARGFPLLSVNVSTNLSVSKDRAVSFGAGDNDTFDEEEIQYDNGKPVVKIHMTGTLTLHEAKGEYKEISGSDHLWIWTHVTLAGQMTVWGWDDDLGWIQQLDTPFKYEDEYSDGQMQFSVAEAVMQGAKIKLTVPDIQGTFTWGYMLVLIPKSG